MPLIEDAISKITPLFFTPDENPNAGSGSRQNYPDQLDRKKNKKRTAPFKYRPKHTPNAKHDGA